MPSWLYLILETSGFITIVQARMQAGGGGCKPSPVSNPTQKIEVAFGTTMCVYQSIDLIYNLNYACVRIHNFTSKVLFWMSPLYGFNYLMAIPTNLFLKYTLVGYYYPPHNCLNYAVTHTMKTSNHCTDYT